jgi:hypothetical protein
MITEKDYEVLFYSTPDEYRFRLGWGGRDPNLFSNRQKLATLEKQLKECSLSEYIQTIIKLFRDKYPNARKLLMLRKN